MDYYYLIITETDTERWCTEKKRNTFELKGNTGSVISDKPMAGMGTDKVWQLLNEKCQNLSHGN